MPALSDVYRVRLYCTYTLQTAINVLYYRCLGITGLGATDQDFATAVGLTFAPLYGPVLNLAALYYGQDVSRILPLPLTVPFGSTAGQVAGSAIGPAMPMQTSAVIKKLTLFAGRHFRGRAYVGFPAASLSTGNPQRPTAAALLAYNAIGTALSSAIIAGAIGNQSTMFPVLFNRVAGTTTNILSGPADKVWGTQRRRGDFGRPNAPPF